MIVLRKIELTYDYLFSKMFQIVEDILMPNVKIFRLISADKLVTGNKYIIEYKFSDIYKGTYVQGNNTYHQFEKMYDLVYQQKLSSCFNCKYHYYFVFIPKKEKIQQAM